MQSTVRTITLRARKEAALARRLETVALLRQRMAGYSKLHGGRFFLFGSASRGTMRRDSDVDVLIDFPDEEADAAWTFLEDLAREHGVPIDMHDIRWCSSRFLEHIRPVELT